MVIRLLDLGHKPEQIAEMQAVSKPTSTVGMIVGVGEFLVVFIFIRK
jgi:hypothetical protein